MRRRWILVLLIIPLLAFAGCKTEPEETTTAAETTTEPAVSKPEPTTLSEGFQTPESVLYDAEQDVYFISNINGAPLAADDNGYISRVNAETLQVESKWIDGTKPEVNLNAPKGMAIVGDELWVTDIDVVRKFDRRSGGDKGQFTVKGSGFLNDLTEAGDGTAYVSDSGLKAGEGGFAPSGTDAIYLIGRGRPRKIASGAELNRPNGLDTFGSAVWVVAFGANELYRIADGKRADVVKLPQGSLDGLVILEDGSFLVSSWDGKAVYRGIRTGGFEAVVENVDSPADIGYDTKRKRLLIPHFMENRVTIHQLQ